MTLEAWNYQPKGGRPITLEFNAPMLPADQGQEILRDANEVGRTIYVHLKRSWRQRLFSWPWRPWQAYFGKPIPMQVTDRRIVDEFEVEFTLVETQSASAAD